MRYTVYIIIYYLSYFHVSQTRKSIIFKISTGQELKNTATSQSRLHDFRLEAIIMTKFKRTIVR